MKPTCCQSCRAIGATECDCFKFLDNSGILSWVVAILVVITIAIVIALVTGTHGGGGCTSNYFSNC